MPLLVKRSVTLSGHETSLALEPEFWTALDAMAKADSLSLARLIRRIDEGRGERPLASACRVAALAFAGVAGESLLSPRSTHTP
jgi:predicted DNA-binding ribbon-helix-helix protein